MVRRRNCASDIRVLPNFSATADPEQIARVYDENTFHRLSALADEHDSRGILRVGRVVLLT